MSLIARSASIVEELLLAQRDLFAAEAKLAERLAGQGARIGVSVADRWPVVHDHLQLYGRDLGRASVLVLAGAPDLGSRRTGIPFIGAREARERLGLDVEGDDVSPSGDAFWRAVGDASLDALFSAALLAHAIPFDAPDSPPVRDASATYLTTLLDVARPQAVVTLGALPLEMLGAVTRQQDLIGLARAPESAWLDRWPTDLPLLRRPAAEAPLKPPFRFRLVALPALDGPSGAEASRGLAAIFHHLLA